MPPDERCFLPNVRADDLESLVWERIAGVLSQPDTIAGEILKQATQRGEARERESFELDVKMTVLGDIKRKRRQWDKAYESDAIDLGDYKEKVDALRTQQAQLMTDIAELEQRIKVLDVNAGMLRALQQTIERVNLRLADAGGSKKKLALEALDVRIARNADGGIEISGLVPMGDSLQDGHNHRAFSSHSRSQRSRKRTD